MGLRDWLLGVLLGDCKSLTFRYRAFGADMRRLGGVYNAGYFRMSTWIPFVWALINALVLILSSFAIHGGL